MTSRIRKVPCHNKLLDTLFITKGASYCNISSKSRSFLRQFLVLYYRGLSRECCEEKKTSYTEAFVQYRDEWHKKAEEHRGFLAGFWDQVVEDHKKWLLPGNFFSADDGKWLQRASNYKELVDPIDIANYERLGFAAGSGGYFEHHNRPSQYVYIEKLERNAPAQGT